MRCKLPVGYLNVLGQKTQTFEREIIVKSFLLCVALLCAVTLSSSSAPSVTNAANVAKKERATITFSQPVTLIGVTLKGDYLFVHDEAAMVRGEACTFVYKGNAEFADKLVVSFHCTPVPRDTVAYFTVRTMLIRPGQSELSEFQFVGSSEAHLVPASPHTAHVAIARLD